MAYFKVEFNTDNAAFTDGKESEIARILRVIAHKVGDGSDGGPVMDCNGNKVGSFEIFED